MYYVPTTARVSYDIPVLIDREAIMLPSFPSLRHDSFDLYGSGNWVLSCYVMTSLTATWFVGKRRKAGQATVFVAVCTAALWYVNWRASPAFTI